MTELKIFGAFRTGSNLVRALLEMNYQTVVHNNNYAYKHIPVPADFKENKYYPLPLKIVATVKDPFAFIDSTFRYCKKNNYLNIDAGDTFEEFCVQPFTVFDGGFENFPRYRFANPAQYWNSLYTNFCSIPEEDIALIRYEDLLIDMQGTIESVAKKYGLERKSESFLTPKGVTINLGDPPRSDESDYYSDQPFERNEYYLERQYMERFTRRQIDFIYSELDSPLLNFFNYDTQKSPFASSGRKALNLYKLLSIDSETKENTTQQQHLLEAQKELTNSQEGCIRLTDEVRSLEKQLLSANNELQTTEARALQAEANVSTLLSKLDKSLSDQQAIQLRLTDTALSLESHQRYASVLRSDLDTAKKNYKAISDSVSYKLGYDLIHAVIKPGKNTALLPFRLARHLTGRTSSVAKPARAPTREPQEGASNIVSTNATQPRTARELNVACIFDQFTIEGYNYECNLIQVPLEDWESTFTQTRPDIFIVESAWRGNGGIWEYKVGTYAGEDRSELAAILQWCNDNDVPTVFWNKEDPVNYDKFIDAARRFDVIFTTDIEMVPKYQEASGHDKVYPLIFSAQPELHNPIRSYDRENKACFAGTYYRDVYEERKKDMDQVLDIAQEFGLAIYDRNYARNQTGENEFSFPERFQKDILGSLDYSEMDRAYKGYRFTINVNSIKHSPTMFSRRVFESLACGTPVLSTPSLGIEKVFGELVIMTGDNIDRSKVLGLLKCDDHEYQRRAVCGIREIFSQHLYRHRFMEILEKCGVNVVSSTDAEVTMIAIAENSAQIEQIITSYSGQIWEGKKLLLLIDYARGVEEQINQHQSNNILPVHLHSAEVLDFNLADLVSTSFVSFVKPSHYYGPHFLTDLMQASIYADADVLGKQSRYEAIAHKLDLTEGEDYQSVEERLNPVSGIIDAARVGFLRVGELRTLLSQEVWPESIFEDPLRTFSVNPWNFIANAHLAGHVLAQEDIEYVSI